MKSLVCVWVIAIILLSQFSSPTESISNEIESPSLEAKTLGSEEDQAFGNPVPRKMVVQIKKRIRPISGGGSQARPKSSALARKSSLPQLCFVLTLSVSFAFFFL